MSSDAKNNMDSPNFQKFYHQEMEDSDYPAPSSKNRICTATARKLNAALVKYQSRGRRFNMFKRRPIETFDGSDAQLLSAEDGSAMPASEAPSLFVLISLLELFCYKETKDPAKANQVFENITKTLLANKMIPAWIMKPGCASNRENVLKYMKQLFLSQPKSLMYKKYNQLRYTQDFKEIGQVGKGGFGSVYEAVNILDGRHYAIKKIPIDNFPDAVAKVFNEVKTLAALDNPYIVRYHSAWIENCNTETISPPGSNVISTFAGASKIKEILDRDIVSAESSDSIVFADYSNSNNNNGVYVENRSIVSVKNISKESKVQSSNSTGNLPVVNYIPSTEVSTVDPGASVEGVDKRVAKISETSMPTNNWSSSSEEENFSHILLIQMELCIGTLKEWLEARNALPQSQIEIVNDTKNRTIFLGMLQGVRCIHAEGIIHRDLKPANIFLKDTTHVKIGDFGLATSRNQTENKMNSPESDRRHLSCGVGTEFYSAPEQLTGNNYDSKSDIYSLGLILLEMYHPCATFMERAEIFKDLKERRKMSDFVSKNFPRKAEIIMAMTNPDQTKRPTAKELLDREQPPSKEEIIRDYDNEVAILKAEIKRLNLRLHQNGNS